MSKRVLIAALSLSVLLNLFFGFRFTANASPPTRAVVSRLQKAERDLQAVLNAQPTPSSVLITAVISLERADALLGAQAEVGHDDLLDLEADLERAIDPLRMMVLTPHTLTAADVEQIRTALAVVRQTSGSLGK